MSLFYYFLHLSTTIKVFNDVTILFYKAPYAYDLSVA